LTTVSFNAPAPPRRPDARHILVMAKSPQPGRVKTRLCPPLSPAEAAEVAAAALADTLDAVAATHADRKIVALDGEPGDWLPPGFEVVPQAEGSFAVRLAAAWAAADGPGLQIGMDTPQVDAELLDRCLEETFRPEVTASLGPAVDGGWWAIGMSAGWDRDVFAGVTMSTAATGRDQLARLRDQGHRVAPLPVLRDVDVFSDAWAVASIARGRRFARVVSDVAGAVSAGTRL
jgi:hypothetical protein